MPTQFRHVYKYVIICIGIVYYKEMKGSRDIHKPTKAQEINGLRDIIHVQKDLIQDMIKIINEQRKLLSE